MGLLDSIFFWGIIFHMEPKPTDRQVSASELPRLNEVVPWFAKIDLREAKRMMSSGLITQADLEALFPQDLPMQSNERQK